MEDEYTMSFDLPKTAPKESWWADPQAQHDYEAFAVLAAERLPQMKIDRKFGHAGTNFDKFEGMGR